jgi:hypothetical protein
MKSLGYWSGGQTAAEKQAKCKNAKKLLQKACRFL